MRPWLLAGLFALAGCVEPAPTPVADEASVITDPGDFEGAAKGSHIHDYWGGQERLTLLEKTSGCQGCTITYGGDHGVPLGSFRADPDHIVPQGTAWVHVTVDWQIQSGDYNGVGLYVKTANTSDETFVGRLESGVPFTFNSTNGDNDPPHHRLSLWRFEARAMSPDGDGATVSGFSASMRVVVERGLPIPVFPPHPDFFQGASELLLHESTRTGVQEIQTPMYYMCGGCLGYHPPDDGKIVPPAANVVEVVLETDGMPGTIDLYVHGADTWDYARIEPDEADTLGERIVWKIPVEGRPDSPYAKQSLWGLYLENSQPGEVKAWRGSYSITVKALR